MGFVCFKPPPSVLITGLKQRNSNTLFWGYCASSSFQGDLEWHPKRREVCKHTYEDMLHSVTTDFKRYSTGVFIQIFPCERVWKRVHSVSGTSCILRTIL